MIEVKFKQIAPLCYLPNGKLVCYKWGSLYVLNDGNIESKFTIFNTFKERILGRSKLAYRLFRLGIRTAEVIDNDTIVISIRNMLYEFKFSDGKLSDGYFCGDGIRPLIFTKVENVNNFENGVYFGGYLSNVGKKPVAIYKRTTTDKWDVVYSFPQGIINHVHSIVSDPYRNCLWIYTGDFDEASAIWKVTDNFKTINCMVCNDQKYRGCVAFALPDGLLYATDAPFADDFIYFFNPDTLESKTIKPIDGSCIYGCQWKDKFVFSTTVEGDGRNVTVIQFLFDRQRGAGIKDDCVHIYSGNLETGFEEIYKEKKDILPLYTFQYGVFKFPTGINCSNYLYFQPVATKRKDLSLIEMNIK